MTPFSVPGSPRPCFLCDGDTFYPWPRDPSRNAVCVGCDGASTTGRFVVRAVTAGGDEVELSRVFTRFGEARLRAYRYANKLRGVSLPATWPGSAGPREVVRVDVWFKGTDGREQAVHSSPVVDGSDLLAAVLNLRAAA